MTDRTQRYELPERVELKRRCRMLINRADENMPCDEDELFIQVWGMSLTYADFREILRGYCESTRTP